MQYQQLGPTGVMFRACASAAMTFGGGGAPWNIIGALSQSEVDVLVGQSLDAGINFFDTANVLRSRRIGEIPRQGPWFAPQRRGGATKVFGRMDPSPNSGRPIPAPHHAQSEESLTRLNTDYIDLYQVHGFDRVTPLEETLSALNDLVRQGKVRYIGCSNLAAWQIMKALGISALQHFEKFVSLQAYYSIAGRDLERDIVPLLQDQKLGLLRGVRWRVVFLSGKYTRSGSSDNDARRQKIRLSAGRQRKSVQHYRCNAGDRAAQRRNCGASGAVLARSPAICDQRYHRREEREKQLKDNLGAVNLALDAEELKKLDEVSRLSPEYPGWMFEFQGSDREPGKMRVWEQFAK